MEMKKRNLNQVNRIISATQELVEEYEDKKETIIQKKPNFGLVLALGSAGTMAAMFGVASSYALDLGAVLLSGMGGYAAGCALPYVVKEIRVGDLNYQIMVNNSIINDLEKEKEGLLAEADGKVKKLS